VTDARTPSRQRPNRRNLTVAGAWIVCAGLLVVALWVLSGYTVKHDSATAGTQRVTATVRGGQPCAATGRALPEDVTFTFDGINRDAEVDACGNQQGDLVDVLVPTVFTPNTVLALADAPPGDASGLSHRVSFLLLVIATAVGGASGYLIFRGRRVARPKPAPAPAAAGVTPLNSGRNWFADSTGVPADLSEPANRS
jgi:hypothetical protein